LKENSSKISLQALGWNAFFQKEFESIQEPGLAVGRIAIENKQQYLLYTQHGELRGEVSGKLLYEARSSAELPKVGDWVAISALEAEGKAIIHKVLSRKSKFSRKVRGKKTDEQVIAANIDIIFIVQGLDSNFNLRRLERYLVMAYESGASPVIILNKTDLCQDYAAKIADVEQTAFDVPIQGISAKTGYGLDKMREFIKEGLTFAFIGSSGVGKSTIINKLLGREILKTREVRQKDSRGRHTTARRELIILPQGGLLIDTPGMREMQLWSSSEGLQETFVDIDELAEGCRFSDCSHTQEKGCAVLAAVETGEISEERYTSYIKLQRELKRLEIKQNKRSYLEEKRRIKKFHREINRVVKAKEEEKWRR
jgi:ribosome biogenesis GTPase